MGTRLGRSRVIAVLLGGAALAACSSTASSPTTTTTTAAHSGSSATTSSTASSSTSSPPTSSGGPSPCATTALTGTIAGSSGAAGTIETTIGLKSAATAPCTLDGYPGLLLLDAAGTGLPTNVVRKGSYSFTAMAPTSVTVTPGGSAFFNIGYSDVPVGSETSCPSSTTLEVTPPNAYDHLVVAATLAPCGGGTMVVSPVFLAGGSNSQTTAPPGG